MTATTESARHWLETTPVPVAPLDAIWGAAGYLSREWGDYGYRIGYAGQYGTADKPHLFVCTHSDGSRFYIATDRYGNAAQHEPV